MFQILNIFMFSILFVSSASGASISAVPGSLLVKRKGSSSVSILSSVHALAGAKSVKKFTYPEGLELVQILPGNSTENAINVYKNDPNVEYVEPNYKVYALDLPNDPYLQYQWALYNANGFDINASAAWSVLKGDSNVVLGTIDTGVDYTHPDLINNIWTNPGEIPDNGIDDDRNGYIDDTHGINAITGTGNPMDDHYHGTHVAGIIAAEGNNGIGVSGVMQKAKVIACKFLDRNGSGDTATAIECMNYFALLASRSNNPVQIVATNNSWGGGDNSKAFSDAVKAHQKLGILFMAAAGNETNNNDVTPSFPSSIRSSNLISVAATDSQGKLASFSNYGRYSVLVAAPGVNILSTIPGARYQYLSGTSMAAPFVTGLAGLLKAKDPSLDWVSLKNLILAGGTPVAGATYTATGRQIRMADSNGKGSISCNNQTISTRLFPPARAYSMKIGQSLSVSVLKINCAKSTQARISSEDVSILAGGTLANDSGQGSDDVAYDGVFNGTFAPTAAGTYNLTFPNNDIVTVYVTK